MNVSVPVSAAESSRSTESDEYDTIGPLLKLGSAFGPRFWTGPLIDDLSHGTVAGAELHVLNMW